MDFRKDLIDKPKRTIFICFLLIILYILSLIIPHYITSALPTTIKVNSESMRRSLPDVNVTSFGEPINESVNVQYIDDKGINPRGEPYIIKASYPKFGIKILDDKVEELINAHVILAKYGDSDSQSHFYNSFEQPYIDPTVISLEIELSRFGNDEYFNQGRPLETTIGINYDRINNKLFSMDDLSILTGLSLREIASMVSSELSKKTNGEKIELEPTVENFSNFVISENEVTFLFQKYQVLSGAAGAQRISIKRI